MAPRRETLDVRCNALDVMAYGVWRMAYGVWRMAEILGAVKFQAKKSLTEVRLFSCTNKITWCNDPSDPDES